MTKKNAAPNGYASIKPRTERDIAADTVVRLLDAGVIVQSSDNVKDAAAALGLSVTEIKEKWDVRHLPKLAYRDEPIEETAEWKMMAKMREQEGKLIPMVPRR